MSGHSKLPWQYRSDNLTSTTYWDIEDADHRILASTGMSRLNAEFIVKACNNYDTLKAKAELVCRLTKCDTVPPTEDWDVCFLEDPHCVYRRTIVVAEGCDE